MRSVDRGDAGQVLSRERTKIGMPTPWTGAEGNILCSDKRELHEDPARSETLFMYRSILRGNDVEKIQFAVFFYIVDEYREASAVNKGQVVLQLDTGGAVFRVGHFEEIIQR